MPMSAPVTKDRKQDLARSREFPAIKSGSMVRTGRESKVKLNDVTVLSQSDWARIQSHLQRREMEEERLRRIQEDRLRLHEMSQEKVRNWTNTVYGQRQKKLEARRQREEEEEEERKKIDVEEAKYQAEQRRVAIERAKTQQYFQTDRLKGFHSALLLSEVLKERDAQLELKRIKEKMNSGSDKELVERANQENSEAIRKDSEERQKQAEKNRIAADFLKAQMQDRARQTEKEKEESQVEAEEIERLNELYREEMRKLLEMKNVESKRQMSEHLRQMEDARYMKDIERMRQEQDDEDCRIFASAKKKIMRMRAEKERDLMIEKQERLDRIREKLASQMKQAVDDEDDRIKRAIEEKEERGTKEEAEKEGKRQKMFQLIKKHREEQEEKFQRQKVERKQQESESLKKRVEADAVFAANESEKQKKRFEDAKQLSGLHLEQADERQRLEQELLEQERDQEHRNRELLDLEEGLFQAYAQGVINHSEKRGRNTIPLQRAARVGQGGGLGPVFPGRGHIRPSYLVSDSTGAQLPNYQRYSTDETKKNMLGDGVSGKRLGFVW